MSDPGTLVADRGAVAIARRIRKIYSEAAKEIRQTIASYNLKFMKQDKEMLKKVADKVITEADYKAWLRDKVFIGKMWDSKAQHCTEVLAEANKQALRVVRNEQLNVFAENMTFQAYELEHDIGVNLGFGVYSSDAVSGLLKKQPELLPRKVIDGRKDKAWNKNKIANEVTKAIIKGDGISDLADNLANVLGSQNETAMNLYARTAMTAAQNAGRQEMLVEAEEDGIKTKKRWVATLDDRTRDAHQDLDGETADPSEPFVVEFDGQEVEIMFPGDPSCDEPGMVYNCRCTLAYEVEGYESHGERRAYREWDDEDGHHRQSYIIGDMTYKEWKKMKAR